MMAQPMLPPGFRFHPTDEELILYYLKRKVMGKPCRFMAISEIDLYKFAPWDLPDMSFLRTKDLEWYFFCPRDKKYPNGSRANQSTEIGYWKVTGKDRTILHDSHIVGMKKSLIFHAGKPPKGDRTDWVMYEYRLSDDRLATSGVVQDSYVICKIFKKSGLGPKIGEQYGAPFNDEDWEDDVDLQASVAGFPFLPSSDRPSSRNPVSTSIADPVPMLLDATAVPMTVDPSAVPMPVAADPVPDTTAAYAIGEPESLSVALSTRMYEELPITTGPTFGMPQYGTYPDSLEMDGIQLDELATILLDPPYHPNYVSVSSQQPSPAEFFGELVYPLDAPPMNGNGAAITGTSLAVATDGNAAELRMAELGSQNYIELNDILFSLEDDYFPDYSVAAASPDIDIDVNAFFSDGPSTSDFQNGGPT